MKMANRYANPWKGFAERWDEYYTAPGRPTEDEKRIFLHYIKKTGIKRPKALVLGATPELRDVLAKANADVTLIDINKKMIDEMTKLRKIRSRERKVVGDWLDMPFEDRKFDIVMGDLVQGNIPRSKKDAFMKEIARVLKKEGYLISRIWHLPKNWKYVDPDRIIERHLRYPYEKKLHMELFQHLLYNTYNKKTDILDSAIIKKWITKYMYKEGRFNHPSKKANKLLERAYIMWKPFEKKWCTFNEKRIERMVKKHFIIIENNRRTKSHRMAESFRIWFLKKK